MAKALSVVAVNQVTGLSRQERRRLRAAQHQLQQLESANRDAEERWVKGKLAYLAMLNPQQAEKVRVVN